MKQHIILILVALAALSMACDPEPFEDPNLDFSNTYPAYVRFVDDDPLAAKITETDGATVTVDIEIPVQVYPDTEVTYEVTGAFTASGTGTVEAGLVEGTISFNVPASALAVGDSLGEATITLVSATNGVVIGRGSNALGDELDDIALPITITK